MVAKFVVFVAFLALAQAGMVRREATTPAPLDAVQQHAKEYQKTIEEQWAKLASSKNTEAVNKAVQEGSDIVLQQFSVLSTALQNDIKEATGKVKEALEQTLTDVQKTATELSKTNPDAEKQAAELRDKLLAALQASAQAGHNLAKEVAANVDAENQKVVPKIKQAYDDFVKQAEIVERKVIEAATKQ